MNRREAERLTHQQDMLRQLGFTAGEAESLRRISMTLHRWHERECGDGNGCIERDEETGQAYWQSANTDRRWSIPDREKGALKRLAAILKARNSREAPIQHTPNTCPGKPCSDVCDHVENHGGSVLSTYIQTDPRGAPLYILRPGDVPEGKNAESYYSRGICIY
jgi:hypothetical protein